MTRLNGIVLSFSTMFENRMDFNIACFYSVFFYTSSLICQECVFKYSVACVHNGLIFATYINGCVAVQHFKGSL